MKRILLLAALALSASPAAAQRPAGRIVRADPALDALIPRDARVERLAGGFDWAEGPVWRRSGGYLLFTDIPKNTIYRWKEGEGLSVFLRPSGYIWPDPPGRELGTNGMAFDAQDRLVIADHGNRQIDRLDEGNYTHTPLAQRYQGKRLNSPNDLVIASSGDVYFTDPPYGLTGLDASPAKELPFNGVYRLTPGGDLTLLTRELAFPNGIALSPDERTLYVANSDPKRPVWMAYDLAPDGSIARGRVLFDAAPLVRAGKQGMPDGLTVDARGNLFASGPGGILVLTPDGHHLGTIETPQVAANAEFGGDGSTLYITSDSVLLRTRTTTRGPGF
jgi:gluconolactonase